MTDSHNRYDKVLSHIPDTLGWCRSCDLSAAKDYLLAPDGLPRVFLGSGGSLSAAHLAAELSVESGIAAVAMTPYQYIFSAWNRLPARVMAFSAGGRNVDVINAFKTARACPAQRFGAMLMSSSSLLANMMAADGKSALFAYPLPYADGFLATNSLAAFYSLLLRIYRGFEAEMTDPGMEENVRQELKRFIGETYSLPTESWDDHNAALYHARETDRFYVLYSPDTLPVAVDLESRFSEGSIGCLQISDYRNFAHGRFNWFHQRKGQTAIIALVTPESAGVAESILSELPPYIPVMRLQTSLSGSAATVDILLRGMYLSKHLGLRWGLDIGAPEVADFGKTIHRKDFIPGPDRGGDATGASSTAYPAPDPVDDTVLDLPIPNIARVRGNIIRGETLWSSRCRRYAGALAEAGVEVVVDLRPAADTSGLESLCLSHGMEYRHFPIGDESVADNEILEAIPRLSEILDSRRCYISCQQGTVHTDIALAVYYMFHRQDFIPDLSGHRRHGVFRCDDIMRRLRSLYRSAASASPAPPGIGRLDEAEFRHRRRALLEENRKPLQKTKP